MRRGGRATAEAFSAAVLRSGSAADRAGPPVCLGTQYGQLARRPGRSYAGFTGPGRAGEVDPPRLRHGDVDETARGEDSVGHRGALERRPLDGGDDDSSGPTV